MGTSHVWIGTDDLFARPSFLSGAARALDLAGTFDTYNQCETAEEADFLALQSDWATVGLDIQRAIDEFAK